MKSINDTKKILVHHVPLMDRMSKKSVVEIDKKDAKAKRYCKS